MCTCVFRQAHINICNRSHPQTVYADTYDICLLCRDVVQTEFCHA